MLAVPAAKSLARGDVRSQQGPSHVAPGSGGGSDFYPLGNALRSPRGAILVLPRPRPKIAVSPEPRELFVPDGKRRNLSGNNTMLKGWEGTSGGRLPPPSFLDHRFNFIFCVRLDDCESPEASSAKCISLLHACKDSQKSRV